MLVSRTIRSDGNRLVYQSFINTKHWEKNIASNTDPVKNIKERTVYAIQDIKAGDEILIDYNCLDEPEYLKEAYYKY